MQTNFNHAPTDKDDCGSDLEPCGDCHACKEYEAFLAIPEPAPLPLRYPRFEDGIGWH